jgi:hypothetical protein
MKLSGLFILILLAGYQPACQNDHGDREKEYQLSPTFQPTSMVKYVVEGGGDIIFTFANEPNSFLVSVERYQFQPRNDTLVLAKEMLDSLDVKVIEDLFAGHINIGGVIYRNDLPTGSWTYVYIAYNSDWLRIANESILVELVSVYRLVCEKLDQKQIS